MADNEIIMTIPFRDVKPVPRSRKSDAVIRLIRLYVSRKLKVDPENVWIDPLLNEKIWERGRKKPPNKIKAKILKFPEEEVVEVHLP
ncbi:MAG: 50S ribosomal protein L31e [Thermoplasmata archaeon]|jgi:large subunit ribosomal protein L31e